MSCFLSLLFSSLLFSSLLFSSLLFSSLFSNYDVEIIKEDYLSSSSFVVVFLLVIPRLVFRNVIDIVKQKVYDDSGDDDTSNF